MTNLIYSQVYTAVAKYLLRLGAEIHKAKVFYPPAYSILYQQQLVNIAIYESKGFTKPVHFGLTPSIIADMWIDNLSYHKALAGAIAIVGADKVPGPWEPVKVLESMPLAVIHARIYWGLLADYEEPPEFAAYVEAFKARNPTPNLHLSPEDEALLDHVPSTKQMRLDV